MTELMWHSPLTTSLLLGLLGCCVGSFINVVVYRLPIMREHPEESSGYNLAWPPSSCPRCGSAIKTQHNLPIISYLWLGGRSACCQGHISRRYIAMEITAGLLAAGISYWLFNHHLDMSRLFALLLPTLLLVWWLVAIAGMLCYSSEDTKTLWQSLLWLGLLTTILRDSLGLNKSILGVCLIYSLALLWNQVKTSCAQTTQQFLNESVTIHCSRYGTASLPWPPGLFCLKPKRWLSVSRRQQPGDYGPLVITRPLTSQRSGRRELLSWRSSSLSASLGC